MEFAEIGQMVSETLATWVTYLYNFYFLGTIYVFGRAWFLVSGVGFVAVTLLAWRTEQASQLEVMQPHRVASGQPRHRPPRGRI